MFPSTRVIPSIPAWHSRPLIPRPFPVTIREAGADDAYAIWEILKAAVRTLIGHPYTEEQIEAWIADEDPARSGFDFHHPPTIFVAESGRRICGFARVLNAELKALYVHPAKRGRKIGERPWPLALSRRML
jgi:GNAT superfamily N-acetyltransferase